METISIKLDDSFLTEIEKAMKKYNYATKTEFIREAIRDKMIDLEKTGVYLELSKMKGKAKRKVSDAELHKIREDVFKELEKNIK